MKVYAIIAMMFVALSAGVDAQNKELAGRWIGQVFTGSHGDMEIALQVQLEKDTWTGALETGHGSWKVTSVTEKDGMIVIVCESADGKATMRGRLEAGKFTGQWTSHMAEGKFELLRSKRQ